jgi:hypothetical protein
LPINSTLSCKELHLLIGHRLRAKPTEKKEGAKTVSKPWVPREVQKRAKSGDISKPLNNEGRGENITILRLVQVQV